MIQETNDVNFSLNMPAETQFPDSWKKKKENFQIKPIILQLAEWKYERCGIEYILGNKQEGSLILKFFRSRLELLFGLFIKDMII